jgi:hypothetical protein
MRPIATDVAIPCRCGAVHATRAVEEPVELRPGRFFAPASALPSASERAASSIAKRVSTCARRSGSLGARQRRTALYRRRRHRWAPDEARRRPTSLPNITPWHDGHAHHRAVSVGSPPRSPGNTTRQRPHWRGDGGPENPGMVPPGRCSGGGVGPACPETTWRVIRFKRGVPTKWTMR